MYNTYYRRGVSTNENYRSVFSLVRKRGRPASDRCLLYQPTTAYLEIGWDIVDVNLAATCSILILIGNSSHVID